MWIRKWIMSILKEFTQHKRPNWDEYFLAIAFLAGSRSRDQDTQHGCVITDSYHIIMGTGYNSLAKGLKDDQWPTSRPDKTAHMIHAEENCLLNLSSSVRGKSATAYVTGQSCNNCTRRLIQAGVARLVMADRRGSLIDDEGTRREFDRLVQEADIRVERLPVDLAWAISFLSKF